MFLLSMSKHSWFLGFFPAQHPRLPSPFCTTMNFISGVPFSIICINKVSLGGDESWLFQGYLCQFCKFEFIIFMKYIECQELYKSWLIWSQQPHELYMSNIFMLQMRQGQEQATYPKTHSQSRRTCISIYMSWLQSLYLALSVNISNSCSHQQK